MKYLFFSLILTQSMLTFASDYKCADEAIKETVIFNFEAYGAGTNSCGVKALNIGDFKETYLVCTSDETESTEYVVVMNKSNCKAKYIAASTQASTPNFDSREDLIDSITCEVDYSDGELICN